MYLVPPTTVMDTLGFDPMVNIQDATVQALGAATASIAASLDTQFDEGTTTDTFFVFSPYASAGTMFYSEFRLRNGFVTTLTSAIAARDVSHFGTSDEEDILASCILNSAKGTVANHTLDLTSKFVRLTYSYGFSPDAVDAELYDPAQVPNWLKEAAQLSAIMHLSGNPVMKALDDGTGTYAGVVNHPTSTTRMQLQQILTAHARYTPKAFCAI